MNPTPTPSPLPGGTGPSWWELLDINSVVSVSAALAAVLSAGAAIGAIFLQYRLLPRPVWVNASAITFMHPATLTWDLKIVNRGNATAHDVRITFHNRQLGKPVEWNHVEVQAFGAPAIDQHMDFSTMSKDGHRYDLSKMYVHVYWRQAPAIEKIRHTKFLMVTPPWPTYEDGEKWMAQKIERQIRGQRQAEKRARSGEKGA